MNDKTICLYTSAFNELLDQVIERINDKYGLGQEHRWIGTEEAMNMLQIKSRTSLLQLRTEGKIRYSQPQHKIILYDRRSILSYIEKHARDTF